MVRMPTYQASMLMEDDEYVVEFEASSMDDAMAVCLENDMTLEGEVVLQLEGDVEYLCGSDAIH